MATKSVFRYRRHTLFFQITELLEWAVLSYPHSTADFIATEVVAGIVFHTGKPMGGHLLGQQQQLHRLGNHKIQFVALQRVFEVFGVEGNQAEIVIRELFRQPIHPWLPLLLGGGRAIGRLNADEPSGGISGAETQTDAANEDVYKMPKSHGGYSA